MKAHLCHRRFTIGTTIPSLLLAATLQASQTVSIPWTGIGALAGTGYKGDGLSVSAAADGARLYCSFQRLEGEASPAGLWLASTASSPPDDHFRVMAVSWQRLPSNPVALAASGQVRLLGATAQLIRPGLLEEYSVSVDGVRQDFVIPDRPVGTGPLEVHLAVDGAKLEPLASGVQLVLEHSGRKIAYSRLTATDASGKELPAHMEIAPGGSRPMLKVVVDDAHAVYPVRIDPTFSDANWVSLNPSTLGASGGVNAALTDASGNLYIGGSFTVVGNAVASGVAMWNGTNWLALGAGISGYASALALSGNTLYVGGEFTAAGGNAITNLAQWNGASWSALGSGVDGYVSTMAFNGTNLYVGGSFATAGTVGAKGPPRRFITIFQLQHHCSRPTGRPRPPFPLPRAFSSRSSANTPHSPKSCGKKAQQNA